MNMHYTCSLLLGLILTVCCQKQQPHFALEEDCQSNETYLVVNWGQEEQNNRHCHFEVSYKNFEFVEISAQNSYPRSGPGGQFEILESSFDKKELALVTASEGKWKKVIGLDLQLHGWLHQKLVNRLDNEQLQVALNQVNLEIPINHLSSAFPWKQLVTRDSLKIKQGTRLPVLKSLGEHLIVWDSKFKRTHIIAKRWLK